MPFYIQIPYKDPAIAVLCDCGETSTSSIEFRIFHTHTHTSFQIKMSPPPNLEFNSPCLFQDFLGFLCIRFVTISFKGPGAKSTKSLKQKGNVQNSMSWVFPSCSLQNPCPSPRQDDLQPQPKFRHFRSVPSLDLHRSEFDLFGKGKFHWT